MELHLTATQCHLPLAPHSVTCHPTQVNTPRVRFTTNAPKRVWRNTRTFPCIAPQSLRVRDWQRFDTIKIKNWEWEGKDRRRRDGVNRERETQYEILRMLLSPKYVLVYPVPALPKTCSLFIRRWVVRLCPKSIRHVSCNFPADREGKSPTCYRLATGKLV